MVVVSDTTTITNLIKVKLLLLIKKLYGQVLIPKAVYEELSVQSAQKKIVNKHEWIKVVTISNVELYEELRKRLDKGESEAITLAVELRSDFLIIDERKGRKVAKEYGLRIIGLVGILVLSKEEKLIPYIKPYMDDLKKSMGFRLSDNLYERVLGQVGEL